jgi:hypothetical protein
MKNIIIVLGLLNVLTACQSLTKNNSDLENSKIFGEPFNDSTEVIVTMDSLNKSFPLQSNMEGVFSGKVTSVCHSRGCWIKLDAGNGKEVYVGTDEKITMPKSIVGKTVTVNGYAYMDTTSVEDLRRYAKQDGKSKEEIEKINEPLVEVSILATGVKIK